MARLVDLWADGGLNRLRRCACRSQQIRCRRGGDLSSGPDGECDGRWPGRFPPSREPRRLVLPRQRRVFRSCGGCGRVRHLRVAGNPGDGLANELAVGARGSTSPLFLAALLSRRETGLAALEVARTGRPRLLRGRSTLLRVEPGRDTGNRGHRQPAWYQGAKSGLRTSRYLRVRAVLLFPV